MAYRYTVREKGLQSGTRNVLVTVDFVDDSDVITHTEQTWAMDLSDDSIDLWAGRVIATLVARDAALASITVGGVPRTPKPEDTTAQELQAAYGREVSKAQAAQLASFNPDLTDAYNAITEFTAAKAAVKK